MAELEIGLQEAENGYDELLDAVEAASSSDTLTWLTDRGRRVAAIVPVDVAEAHEAWLERVLHTPLGGPIAEKRRQVQQALTELGLADLASSVSTDAATLLGWQRLLELARAAKVARS